ncbi:HAD-IIIA family hydrolase [Candidatus Thiosymbion oneisti]|uniref:HAD-IIIA family hydrolase n=1 Tax=Candidatus Thiosymbion oneisti TaxID=589554 RepID=UPI00105CC418|nr:HAD-IIIA family hydrolase [Candidatus Thiosymbion oneisti]
MFFSIHTQRADQPKPAIFLDRDGTINVEKNYLYRIEDWEWIPGAKEAIKRFKQAGYLVVVVSNQVGIAR